MISDDVKKIVGAKKWFMFLRRGEDLGDSNIGRRF